VIQLSGLTKSFGERVLLDDVSWQVTDGERVGLCGPNGAGKTTLLKMLAGFDEPDQGLIVKPTGTTVGYLPQDGLHHHGRTIFSEVSLAFEALLDAQKEIDRIEHALADPALPDGEHETLLVTYHELSERFRRDRPDDLAGWRNLFLRTDSEGYCGVCATLRDTDLRAQVGNIATPTLVVVGEEDASTPVALVREWAAGIAGARFEIIPGAGHIPSIEQPAALAALMTTLFKEAGHG